ncbi:hypothetical protein IAU60_006914 [Kwoniella sp. DSM 27419]
MSPPYDNYTLLPWALPVFPGSLSITSCAPLWEHAAVPPSYLAVDSHQALTAHVAPPRQQPGANLQRSESVPDPDDLLPVNKHESDSEPTPGSGARPRKKLKTSAEMRRLVTKSSRQRSPRSARAKEFWQALKGSEPIRFEPISSIVPQLIRALQRRLAIRPNTEPRFLGSHNALMIAEENRHSRLTPSARAALRAHTERFHTYAERERSRLVDFKIIGGQELGSTSATVFGICRIANNYIEDDKNFRVSPGNYRYRFAPEVESGVSDIAARQDPDVEAQIADGWLQTPTAFLIEVKLNLTHRDLAVLVYVLRADPIYCRSGDGGPLFEADDDGDVKLLSAAVKSILAQLYQQLHVNRSRYVLLSTHDVSLLFFLNSKSVVNMSGLILRDYEVFYPLFTQPDLLEDLLQLVQPDTRRSMVAEFSNPNTNLIEDRNHSLLSILVAGLTVSMRNEEDPWLRRPSPLASTVEEGHPTETSTTASTTGVPFPTRSSTASSQDAQSSRFSVIPSDLAKFSIALGVPCTHSIPFEQMGRMQWVQLSPKPSPRVVRLSMGSDTTVSDGTAPSLVTDSSGDTESTAQSQIRPQSPEEALPLDHTHHIRGPSMPNSDPQHLTSLGGGPIGYSSRKIVVPDIPSHERCQGRKTVSTSLKVQVNERIGSGRLWDVYRANVSITILDSATDCTSREQSPVIAKFCVIPTYSKDAHRGEETETSETEGYSGWSEPTYDQEKALLAIKNELAMLNGPLWEQQGQLCPSLYGLWEGRCDGPRDNTYYSVHCMVLEDCGQPIKNSTGGQSIMTAYDVLHRHHVHHGDINAENILQDQEGRVRLIDFEASTLLTCGAEKREGDGADLQVISLTSENDVEDAFLAEKARVVRLIEEQ